MICDKYQQKYTHPLYQTVVVRRELSLKLKLTTCPLTFTYGHELWDSEQTKVARNVLQLPLRVHFTKCF